MAFSTSKLLLHPSNVTEFKRKFPDNAQNTVHTLSDADRFASGSRWHKQHLKALRVLLSQRQSQLLHQSHLPVLESYIERSRIRLKQAPDNIYQNLVAVKPKDLKHYSHQDLRKLGHQLGAFHTRLADVTRLDDVPDLRRLPVEEARSPRPTRNKGPPDRFGFPSSEELESLSFGTESSEHSQSEPSRSERSESLSFSESEIDPIDKSEHISRTKHEMVTAGVVAEFISSITDLSSEQTYPDLRIEFTLAPTTYSISSHWLKTVSQDDGSLIRRFKRGGTWALDMAGLALVEAKAMFKSWNKEGDIAQLSENVLAQIVSEMVSCFYERIKFKEGIEKLNRKDHHLFVISVHQTTLTFLHTTIEREYVDYLESIERGDDLPFLRLTSSAQFDIENVEERVEAAVGIMSLVSFLNQAEET